MRKNILLFFATTSIYAGAQQITIPDTTFKTYLLENFDTNNDGEISVEEARTVRKIECTDKPLTSLQGIEYFTALEELDCSYANYFQRGGLTSLDLSRNQALKKLHCDNNRLDSLDISQNVELTELHCRNNLLRSLDVSRHRVLEELLCDNNRLTQLRLDDCRALALLHCGTNRLESLDISSCPSL